MKRVLSLILAVMLLLQINLLPVEAASKNTDFEKKILTLLELVPAKKADTEGLSRLELAEIISNIVLYKNEPALGVGETVYVDVPHTDEAALVINTVTQRGVMSGVGEGKFDPDSSVTLNQAICTVVNLLGYKNAALADGGFPGGFTKMASNIGLLKGVNLAEETITFGNLKTLLANALATEVMVMTGVGEDQKYEILNNETLLEYEMGLNTAEGVVRGSKLLAMTEESFTKSGRININGNVYEAGEINPNDYVGYYVRVCYIDDEDADYPEIIHLEKDKKNETFTIYSDEFRSWSEEEIVYIKNGESKKEKAKLTIGADVMHNGTPLTIYNEDSFDLADGAIELIDNTGDGRYDVIKLVEYKTTVVKNINIADKKLLDSFSSANSLDLNGADDESIRIFDAEGEEMKFSEIAVGDTVSWYVDRTGENYTLIVAIDTSILGSVTGKDTELGVIYIDEEEYRVAPSYLDSYNEELKYGKSGTFYTDYLGRIVGFKDGEGVANEWMYGWLLLTVYDEETDRYLAKICSEEGIEQYYTLTKKVKIDFEKFEEPSSEETTHPILGMTPGIIKYMVNAFDEITKIDTTAEDTEKGSLTQIYQAESLSWKGSGTDSFVHKLIANKKTKVFIVPAGEGDIEVRGYEYFVTDRSYPNLTAYGPEDSKIAEVIVLAGSSGSESGEESIGLLSEIVTTLNSSDEARCRMKIRSITDPSVVKTYWGVEGLDASEVKSGQLVSYTCNGEDEITKIKLKYDPISGRKTALGEVGQPNHLQRSVLGKVGKLEEGKYAVIIPEDATRVPIGEDPYEVHTLSSYKIYKYDETSEDKLVAGSIGDISDFEAVGDSCSRVIISTSMYWPQSVIIFNESN